MNNLDYPNHYKIIIILFKFLHIWLKRFPELGYEKSSKIEPLSQMPKKKARCNTY